MTLLRRAARRLLESLDLYSSHSLRQGGALREDGWFRSFREQASVDAQGLPIPWLTYPAINFLAPRLRPDMALFEFGCGGSTLWWASRVQKVVSCEHDRAWYERIAPKVPANVTLRHIELERGGEYCRAAAQSGELFDVLVVDGRDRVNCIHHSLAALKPEGVIIWDNSDRSEYEEGYQALFEKGFKKIAFKGMAPIIGVKNETGVFYRPENCLGI